MNEAVRSRLVFDGYIPQWCEKRIKHFSGWGSDPRSIGLEVGGELRAAVVYTQFSGANVFASIVADGPLSRKFVYTIFYNPFIAWQVRHISCAIEESNLKSIALCTHMGFSVEGRLRESAVNGEDILIMGLLKRECRFLSWGPK